MKLLRILVVDDEIDAAQTFAVLLQVMGHDARFITDARKVIDMARRWQPEVMFLDISMPAMDGYQLAAALRGEHGQALWMCAITGHGSPEDRERSRKAGFDAHVHKPVDPALLDAILEQFSSDRK